MHKQEYLFLKSAIRSERLLREVGYTLAFSDAQLLEMSHRLFQRGDITAKVYEHQGDRQGTRHIVLNRAEIQAVLNGRLRATYELTPQGGERWESLAQANWEQHFSRDYRTIDNSEIVDWTLIGRSRALLEDLVDFGRYLNDVSPIDSNFSIPGSATWELLDSWKPLYWKTLLQVWKVCYQSSPTLPENLAEGAFDPRLFQSVKDWYAQVSKWYSDPNLAEETAVLANELEVASLTLDESTILTAKYCILSTVVTEPRGEQDFDFATIAIDLNLSYGEIGAIAYHLFQEGMILADFVRDGVEVLGVGMTPAEIQNHINGQLCICYYLTLHGGEYWESIACPQWNQYYKFETVDFSSDGNERYREMSCVDRAIIEKYFSIDRYLDYYETRIPGTEVWDTVTPWQATYWKSLQTAHRVQYRTRRENVDEALRRAMSCSTEEEMVRGNARVEWQTISEWYGK